MVSVLRTIISSNAFLPISAAIRVQAFDKYGRSEERLDEALLKGLFSVSEVYKIEHSKRQFQSAEAKSADLIIRAHTGDGRFAAESDITSMGKMKNKLTWFCSQYQHYLSGLMSRTVLI